MLNEIIGGRVYQEQRLNKILELLAEKRQLSAKEMVDYFHVSKDTIRGFSYFR